MLRSVLVSILALLCLLLPRPALASSIYYVSPTGVDTNPCTSTLPCATLQYAANLAVPGDTVKALAGTYYGPQEIKHIHGTADLPITISGGSAAILEHGPNPPLAEQQTPLLSLTGDTYIKLQGFTLNGMRGRSDVLCDPNWSPHCAQPYGGELVLQDHNADLTTAGLGEVIDHNTVNHSENTCFKTEDHESGVVFSRDHATDCGQGLLDHCYYSDGTNELFSSDWCDTSGGYGIQSWSADGTSTDNVQFLNNTVENVAYGGIIGIGNNNVYSGNLVVNADTGFNPGPNSTFDHNVIQNVRFGIEFANAGNDTVTHNTIQASQTDIMNGSGHITASNVIEDNILQSSSTAYNAIDGGLQKWGGTIDYNRYYQAAPPTVMGANDSRGDPLFVSATDVHLQSTSPCIGTASDGTNRGRY